MNIRIGDYTGDFNITEEESLKLVKTQLKQTGRYEKVIAMKVKQ